ncbi:hypothetical protein [Kibdelosporangium philippinense]
MPWLRSGSSLVAVAMFLFQRFGGHRGSIWTWEPRAAMPLT